MIPIQTSAARQFSADGPHSFVCCIPPRGNRVGMPVEIHRDDFQKTSQSLNQFIGMKKRNVPDGRFQPCGAEADSMWLLHSSISHLGVDVAPQIPTEAQSRNQSMSISCAASMRWVLGFTAQHSL